MSRDYPTIMETLTFIAAGRPITRLRNETWMIEGKRFSVRYSKGAPRYHHVNQKMLSVDYTVFICGTWDHYYIVPSEDLRQLQIKANEQRGHRDPKTTPFSINTRYDEALYGDGQVDFWGDYRFGWITNLPRVA